MSSRIDDLALLALVVEAGSFTAASRVTGIQKSRLSRRIADLETNLGVRLIERTSRSFHVTELGMLLYRHGASIRTESEAALALAQNALAAPTGPLCIACPVVLAEMIVGDVAISFATEHPQVQLTFDVVNGLPNDRPDRYDMIFRAATGDLPDSEMIARQIMRTPYKLVASPAWMATAGHIASIDDLAGLDGIGWWQIGSAAHWDLRLADGSGCDLPIRPRFLTNNLRVARQAALAGLGMARLPLPLCQDDLASGELQLVLPGLAPPPMVIYVAYPTRRSLTAAGRKFLAYLETRLALFFDDSSVPGDDEHRRQPDLAREPSA